jgi:membrane-associated protein
MELINKIIDFALHLDRYLSAIIQQYGLWTYVILFAVIFIETGFVVMPFLPGDSLLFAAGTFAALKAFKVGWLILVLAAAAIIGDTVNYWIGHYVGPKVFNREKARFFKKEHLDRTHAFFEKYGGKTIIIARFVPIVRSFAPLVAGIGRMSYGRFIAFNVIGGVGWVVLLVGAGYFFGNIPVVRENFSLAILAIIAISTIPIVTEFLRHRKKKPVIPPGL